jgi:hypothetical protein
MSEPEARASCHDKYSDYVEQGLELQRVAYIDGRTIEGRLSTAPVVPRNTNRRLAPPG